MYIKLIKEKVNLLHKLFVSWKVKRNLAMYNELIKRRNQDQFGDLGLDYMIDK